jgi:hypothetical protein
VNEIASRSDLVALILAVACHCGLVSPGRTATQSQTGPQCDPVPVESGNIAYSLARDTIRVPFRPDTGPTPLPVYPLLIVGIFRVFGINTFHSASRLFLNILFSTFART